MATNRFFPSIFNDVLAPVTQGPSSSNTVGPYRIGTLTRAILDGPPKDLLVEMSTRGDFMEMFYSMSSDKALLSGLLGRDLIADDLEQAYAAAEAAGLICRFQFTDRLPGIPSELMELTVSSSRETLRLSAATLGGGEIMIREINGTPCDLRGMRPESIELEGLPGKRSLPSVYPLRTLEDPAPPFATGEEMLACAKATGKALWELALDYEQALTGLSAEAILAVAGERLDIAYRAIESGYRPGLQYEGVSPPLAHSVRQRLPGLPLLPSGISDGGALDALAVMDHSNAHGIIVCMPTGGCSGVIPAAIRNAAAALGRSREEEVRALLAAGLIGVFYYPTHYHGALGCQAEVGVAASMAAGALASFQSRDAAVAETAAVLAMQSLLGQLCDPIGGYVQAPCIIRNMTAVSVAVTCANAALMGMDALVSLDEMCQAVLRTGEKLHSVNLLGTCACACRSGSCPSG